MAEVTVTVRIEDLPEFKERISRIKKIIRKREWKEGRKTKKGRS